MDKTIAASVRVYTNISSGESCALDDFLEIIPAFVPENTMEELQASILVNTIHVFQQKGYDTMWYEKDEDDDYSGWYLINSSTGEEEKFGELCQETLNKYIDEMENWFDVVTCSHKCRCDECDECDDEDSDDSDEYYLDDNMICYEDIDEDLETYCLVLFDNGFNTIYKAKDVVSDYAPDGMWIAVSLDNDLDWYEELGTVLMPYELFQLLEEDSSAYGCLEYTITEDGLKRLK